MKKTVFERLAALLCAAAMVLTILPLPAAAEDGAVPTISVETYSVAQGGSATVYVYGKNLTSFHTLTMNLFYDSEVLTYKSCSSSSMEYALGNGETAGQVTVSAIHSRGLTVSGTSKTLLFRLYFDVSRNAPLGETPLQIDITYASDATGTITPEAVNGTLKITEYVTPVVTFNLKGNSAVQAGERIELILNSSNLKSLCGGQFAFQYDDKIFRYESLELLSAMQTDTAVQSVYAQNSGQVILSYASATKPSSGDLMKLTLTTLENAEGETEISLRPTSLYDVNREVLQSTSVSKTVTVTKLEVQPVFPKVWLDIPEELTMDQPFTVTVMVSGDGNISAADMQFTYDSTLLEVTDVTPAQSSKEDFSGLTVTANPAKFQNGKGVFTVISMDGITEETALVNITLKALENHPSAAEWETQIAVSASGVVDRTGDDVVVQPGTSLLTIQVPVYTVTFLEHDGTLLKQQPVFYLNAAAAPEVQGKEANDQQHFLHSGWDHDFSVITTDLTVTAVYQAETHNFEDAVWQRKDEQLHVRTCTGCTVQESASHRWDEGKETTAPGCITAGVMTYICTDCSAVREEDIAALDHDWDEGTVTTPATCTGDGILTRSCSRCDQKQLETIKAPGHQESAPVKENIVAATCTSKGGYDEVVYCSVCHEVLKRTPYETEKLAHTEGEAVQENYQAATCTQDGGYDTVTYCTVCKAELSRVHTTLEALGHDYAEDFTVDKEPTCTAEGSKSRHCSACDSITDVTVIEALGHDWDQGVVTTAPTCTADGVLTENCARCKATQTKAITAAGHKEDSAVQEKIVEATCTAAGSYDEVIYCAVCHAELSRIPHTISMLPHTEGAAVQENYQAATCTQNGGYDMATYCTVCKVQLSRVHTTLEAPGHDYAEDFTVDKEPTCTAEGSQSRHCSACDDVTEVTVIEALGHDWDKGVVTTPVNCTSDGVLTRTCTRCDQQQTETIKAPGHQESDPVKENIVPATCTSRGSYDEVIYCSVCDAVLKSTPYEMDKLAHTEGQAVQENYQDATCTENGGYDIATYCTVCKAELSRVSATLEAPGHDYAEDFTVDKESTCTAEGSKSRHCSACDDVTEVTVIEARGHDWDEGVVTTAPTCTVDGVLTEACTRCDVTQTKAITAAGHKEDSAVRENIVDATCTAAGSYDEVIYCSVCDAELSRVPNTIPLLAHIEGEAVQEETVDSTCTSAGSYDLVTYCTVCHQELSREHQDTAASGHDYDEDFTIDKASTCTEAGSKSRHCSRCNSKTDVTAIEALGHDWNEGSITKEPSCTETGTKTKICLRCSQTMTETVAAKGHTSGEAVQETPVSPTCTETGSYESVVYCSVCSAEISRSLNTVEKLGHAPEDAVIENRVEPSCEGKGGYDTVIYCSRCASELSRVHTVLDALGHDYAESFTVDREPTCVAEGSKSRHCSRCESKTDITAIEELGHAWGEEIIKAATCTADGSVTKSCSRCDVTEVTILSALGHTQSDAVKENEKAPSCTENGSYESVIYCSVCSAEISRSLQTVEKLGHAPEDAVTEKRVEPSCEGKGGYDTVIYCGRCSSELSRVHTVLDALGHDYAEDFTVDREPTCVAEGSKSRHCSRCESKTDITAIEELGHAWGEEIVKAATCTEDGSVTKSCSRCDVTEVTTLSALGHTQSDAVKENEKAPSCTETGSYESVIYCSVCNAEISRSLQTVEKLGHAPKEAVTENRVEPSCEGKGGYDTVIYCGRCSSELSREHTMLDALGHDYAESFTVDKEPTCVAEGSKSRHCSRCESKADITAIEEFGHAWGEEIVKAATCTEDGSVTKSCTRCDITEVKNLSALGHTQSAAVKENEKAPSCTESGSYESVVYCSVCNAEISRSLQTVEKLGHAPKEAVTENRVEPSCEGKGGYDTVIYCSRCSSELSRVHTVLDALGHDYAEDFTVDREPTCVAEGSKSRHCSRCESKTDITAIEELGHAWGEEIIKAATCTADGSVTKSCSRCNKTESTVVSALGHKPGSTAVENEKKPNCVDAGSYEEVVRCTVCSTELSRKTVTVSALGHTAGEETEENRVEPSCQADGGYELASYCQVCHKELKRSTVVLTKLGHDYAKSFTVDQEATCTSVGSKSRHCSRCDSKTEVIELAALGHSWDEGIITTAPTCTANGIRTKTCIRCDATKDEGINALGHVYNAAVRENEVAASCMAAGSYDSVIYCAVCQAEISRISKVIEMLAHTLGQPTVENEREPSCTVDGGYDTVVRCTVCNTVVSGEHTVIGKLGHTYGKPSFQWADDLKTCTASFYCNVCEEDTENKLLTVSCSVTENETESASCSKEGKKTITAMAVLGETVYTDQQTQSIPMTNHRVDTWTAEGIEGHSAVCKDCKKTVNTTHSWLEHACSLCGQKDAYLVLEDDTVTVFAVNIEAGTKILIAGYAEGGRCISVVAADWGTENDLQVKLPSDELVQKVHVYFVNQNWTPIRSHIEQ